MLKTANLPLVGSSPHVRGALRRGSRTTRSGGIIPACAGSTISCTFFRRPAGIIPACAGSTKGRSESKDGIGDHPRMCGEHPFSVCVWLTLPGSSPHVRGALLVAVDQADDRGIIPACAGSTCSIRTATCSTRDHPRMCGEHGIRQYKVRIGKGSSPHVRGARNPTIQGSNRQGIIPACAGSTKCSSRTAPTSRDHPRMCGEHWRPHLHAVVEGGIIPACAGSTRPASGCPSCRRDHPRMCGEHLSFIPIKSFRRGSSPHVRGALAAKPTSEHTTGIIPACAGSTR